MAPKKKAEVQKLSLGEFLNPDPYGGSSWADEVEDSFASGTQALPSVDRRSGMTSYGGGGDRGYHSLRDNLPQSLPTRPPFTAHLGNLSYDATVETVTDFFQGCNVVNVRIIEDREQQRPKGFAYAEFEDLEGLKSALTLDGQNFQGRTIRIKVAEPSKNDRGDRPDFNREMDWSRKGPLPDLPGRGGDRPSRDFGDRKPREFAADDGKVRDFGNWERRGPLSPLPQATENVAASRDGSRTRMGEGRPDAFGGDRRQSPAAWGPGEARTESRPPRREFSDRPERAPTAAEQDSQWRNKMRPDAAQSREGSEAPTSPSAQNAQPAGRRKLNLVKRTVSEAPAQPSPAAGSSDSKASPFGAARPIDTAAKEREIEEKRLQALKEKKEADEKAKEEKRLAKEAAIKEAAEQAEKEKADAEAAAAAAAEAAVAAEAAAAAAAVEEANKEATKETKPAEETKEAAEEPAATEGSSEKAPARAREPREAVVNPKSRAAESGNWRRGGGDAGRAPSRGSHAPGAPRGRGGAPRAPRGDGPARANGNAAPAAAAPATESAEPSPSTPATDDGWTTVPNKGRRGGRALA